MRASRMTISAGAMLLAMAATSLGQDVQSADRVTSFGPTRIVTLMTGDQMIGSVATRQTAHAIFDVKADGSVRYKITTTGLDGVTGVYVHEGKANQIGPVIAAIYMPDSATGKVQGTVVEGTLVADNLKGDYEGKSVNDVVAQMMDNNAYITLTTSENPKGELRGNIPYPY